MQAAEDTECCVVCIANIYCKLVNSTKHKLFVLMYWVTRSHDFSMCRDSAKCQLALVNLAVLWGTQRCKTTLNVDTCSIVHDIVRGMNKASCKYSSSHGPSLSSSLDEVDTYAGAWGGVVVVIVIERSWAWYDHHCCHRLGLGVRRRRVRLRLGWPPL